MTKHRSLAEPRTCEHCSKPLLTRFQVKYDSLECARLARGTAVVQTPGPRGRAVIEDVQWIIGTDLPSSIATRVGYANVRSLARALYRWGQADMALRLEMEHRGDEWSATA